MFLFGIRRDSSRDQPHACASRPTIPLSLSPRHLSQRSPSPLLLVLVSSPRRFPRERRFGPAIPSHPSARARPPGALSLSLSFSISIRHRAVRSLPSRAYDAPSPSPPSPSTLATMTRRRERCRSSRLFFLADHTRRFFSFGLKPTREGRWVVVVVVEVVERKRIRLVERAVQKAR